MYLQRLLAHLSLSSTLAFASFSNLQLRIAPVGDSITHGTQSEATGGYRGPLLSQLDGNFVNYVGPFSDSQIRDNNHQGGPGFFISDIVNWYNLSTFSLQPNVILLDAGTNDAQVLSFNATIASNAMFNFLLEIYKRNSNPVVLVAQIGPLADSQHNANAQAYNQKLATVVNNLAAYGVRVANVYFNLTLSDISSDGIHPLPEGYVKIANAWYNEVNSLVSSNPSWFGTPALGVESNHTYAVCPDDAWILIQQNPRITGLANSQNQFGGINCTAVSGSSNQCSCVDPASANPTSATIYPVYSSCAEMSTGLTQAVQFADINGDGRDDYVYVGPQGQATYWLTTGQGVNGSSLDNDAAGNITVASKGQPIFGGTYTSTRTQVRFADLNGDGRVDLLLVGVNGSVTAWQSTVVYSTSNGQTDPGYNNVGQVFSGAYGFSYYPGAGLHFVDLDSDGLADMVYIASNGVITAFKNQGASGSAYASFAAPVVIYPNPPAYFGRDTIVLADFNGDGRADLVLINRFQGSYTVYESLNPFKAGYNSSGPFVQFNSTARFSQASPGANGMNYQFANIGGTQRWDLVYVDPNTSSIQTNTTNCVFLPAGNALTQG